MRTFYDWRSTDYKDPKKYPLQGRVILKNKNFWICKIYTDAYTRLLDPCKIKGYIVAPRTIYLYNIYFATSLWDALKYFIKVSYGRKSN
jgi:hypothetical protein